MLSRAAPKRVRKTPEARRAEIVAAASALALTEGLECLTLRRVADELAVRPGLISHYFPAVEDLVAEAFGAAATAELDDLIPADRPAGSPLEHLARFFVLTTGAGYDGVSRLWLNAWHLSRYRPALRERVDRQETLWRERLAGLVRDGVEDGSFESRDPDVTAARILVVLDGLGSHANTDRSDRPPEVTHLAVVVAERELNLPEGSLVARVTAAHVPRPAPDEGAACAR
ncbi:TetR/AcrR family transcriptional regulator [Actinomadura verrucosospora]|uniref:TetR family transcriptional regulator n=1 Tax=Actinomadura verrucosospora TaxID=46165 RepID=A0A7D4A3F4_ACTVE|nr:TetR family transcriptional regulator C-terminal domain-containing protein [Actinomadura verrucosospora]QKG21605.1 TetR family transcriptional regulator [Actinomadura verrucosospora]